MAMLVQPSSGNQGCSYRWLSVVPVSRTCNLSISCRSTSQESVLAWLVPSGRMMTALSTVPDCTSSCRYLFHPSIIVDPTTDSSMICCTQEIHIRTSTTQWVRLTRHSQTHQNKHDRIRPRWRDTVNRVWLGEEQMMSHLLCWWLLVEPCTPKYLSVDMDRAQTSAKERQHIEWGTWQEEEERPDVTLDVASSVMSAFIEYIDEGRHIYQYSNK